MAIFYDLKTGSEIFSPPPFVAALGDFDGVHLGHRAVIERAVASAASLGVRSAVWRMTGNPKGGAHLCSEKEKDGFFKEIGADFSIIEKFSAVSSLSPEEFVKDYLPSAGCVGVVCGFNFRFGKGASGNADDLRALCEKYGLFFDMAPPVDFDGEAVSSTRIRSAIAGGDAEAAKIMLGHYYSVTGEVTHGRMLGHKLGFPTVNQNFAPGAALPRHGVYFTYTSFDGKRFPSVTNVGSRPTVGGHVCRAETHILGDTEDLYGKTVTVSFVKFRRPEVAFGDVDELKNAISLDKAAAEAFFENYKEGASED